MYKKNKDKVVTGFCILCMIAITCVILRVNSYQANSYNKSGLSSFLRYNDSKISRFSNHNISRISSFLKTISLKRSELLSDPFLQRHEYKNLINSDVCQTMPDILILVISATTHNERRNTIRSTWGSVSTYNNMRIKHLFVLGQPLYSYQEKDIAEESLMYHDFIQGNFEDKYRNLLYKFTYIFYWIDRHCRQAKYIVTVDDDVLVNIPVVVKVLLNNKTKLNNCLLCYAIQSVPIRDKSSKYFISKTEYSANRYPRFCVGSAVIMSPDVATKLLAASVHAPFVWVPDVYAYGVLTGIAGVQMSQPPNFRVVLKNVQGNVKKTHMFILLPNGVFDGDESDWKDIWNKLT